MSSPASRIEKAAKRRQAIWASGEANPQEVFNLTRRLDELWQEERLRRVRPRDPREAHRQGRIETEVFDAALAD